MKKIVSLAAGLVLVAGVNTAAQAQLTCTTDACTVTHTVSATAPTVLRLSQSAATTSLTNPVEADFDGSAIQNAGPDITVKSNKLASVTIGSAGWSGPALNTKVVGDLSWSIDGTTYTPMTASASFFAAGKGTRLNTITWRTLWKLSTDTPGAYSMPVVFTLAAP